MSAPSIKTQIVHWAPSKPILIRNNSIYPSFSLACLREHPPRPEPKKGARPSAEVVKRPQPALICMCLWRSGKPRPYGWYLGFPELSGQSYSPLLSRPLVY